MRQTMTFTLKKSARFLLLAGGIAALQPSPVRALQSVTLNWNPSPSPNVRGYEIYYGTNCGNYTSSVVVSKNATNTTVWGLAGGQTYHFAARSFNSALEQSDYSSEAVYTLPPDATNQPPILTKLLEPKTFVAGQTFTFSISALGTGTLNYQWQFNGQNLPDATNAVLTLSNATADQAGIYSVIVTDDIGTTNSNPAVLTLHAAPASTALAATLTTVTGLAAMNDSDHPYAFDVSGVAGEPYVVQASPDLHHWVSVQTNLAPFTFVETGASQSGQQFYRAFHQ